IFITRIFIIGPANTTCFFHNYTMRRSRGLEMCIRDSDSTVRGWRSIHVTDGDQPYMDKWWVPGLSVGYEHSFVH
ncbi:hypothetical protein, partial [Sphingobacterium daejeonense]|uniref:hypothetical protein n=1 Tax=Sphingobacterium daejeonense TaxID=371142 RepID=UPI003D322AE6